MFIALAFWEESRSNRLEALQEYLRKQEFRKELRLRGFEPESESDDDSRFAMYKSTSVEADINKLIESNNDNIDYNAQIENLENTLQKTDLEEKESKEPKRLPPQKLTVIDPGPSTSKCSTPWVDDETFNEPSMMDKVKSVGRVREKITKGKIKKKPVKRRKVSLTQDRSEEEIMDSSDIPIETSEQDHSNSLEAYCNKLKSDNTVIYKENSSVEKMEVDETLNEESDRLLSVELGMTEDPLESKEKKKREKREAKMKEISERIKALSNNSSIPNS